jgi:hypothetical protein
MSILSNRWSWTLSFSRARSFNRCKVFLKMSCIPPYWVWNEKVRTWLKCLIPMKYSVAWSREQRGKYSPTILSRCLASGYQTECWVTLYIEHFISFYNDSISVKCIEQCFVKCIEQRPALFTVAYQNVLIHWVWFIGRHRKMAEPEKDLSCDWQLSALHIYTSIV